MKKFLLIIIIVSTIVILNSCNAVKVFYGIRTRNDEDRKEQIKYLLSINVDTSNLYNMRCEYSDSMNIEKYAINTNKTKSGISDSPVQVRMYDSLGNFIYGWEQCMGNANAIGIFDNVPMSNPIIDIYELPVNMKLNFFTDINLFEISSKEKDYIIENNKKHKYTIILFWAKWNGVFTKRIFRDVDNYIKNNPQYDFFLLKLNAASYCE